MAFNNRPAIELNIGMEDEMTRMTATQLSMAAATTNADALAALATITPLLQPMSLCSVVQRSFTYSARDDAPALAQQDARREAKGTFIFNCNNGKTVTITIPGFDETKVQADGKIDPADADVLAFITAMTDPANGFTDSNGAQITSIADAYLAFRGTTRTP